MLISMAAHDTSENNRTWMTRVTLESLRDTVDWSRHRLMISDNGSCEETHALYQEFEDIIQKVIYNGKNLGTANALNLIWRERHITEAVLKIDNDVRIHRPGWLEMMELAFEKDPKLGIVGLKRRDLDEWPIRPKNEPHWATRQFSSRIYPLPHKKGEPWLILEECQHVMGTCQAYHPRLLQRIGYLIQPGLYGLDDSLAAVRCKVTGYRSCFLHGVEIDHVDPGGTEYIRWKSHVAGKDLPVFNRWKTEYLSGKRDVFFDGGFGE